MDIIIADDEPLARDRLRSLLAERKDIVVVAEAGSGTEVLTLCTQYRPDLVLLDISMPGLDGLETARRLNALDNAPAVVFCTAYDHHALEAFNANAVHYLVKPVRKEHLFEAIERVRRRLSDPATPPQQQRTHLQARLGHSLRLIPIDDVYYLQAQEKYVVVHHARGEDVIEESLKSLEEEFHDYFIRIHRACLIARKELLELRRSGDGHALAFLRHVEQPLEVSRRCLSQLRGVLEHH